MRAPRYKKHSAQRTCAGLVFLAAVVFGVWKLAPQIFALFSSDPQTIVENSVLKSKNFSAPVVEIISPKTKLKAYLLEDDTNPIISLNFSFKNAGYASDDVNEQGIAQMAAALLTEGAGDFSGQALKEALESLAIKISFAAGKDDFSGSMLTTKANAREAVQYLNLMLASPRFEEADIKRVKAQMKEALKRQDEYPARALELEFIKELYGEHPYGRNPLGKPQDIEKISAADLHRFVKNNFSQNNLIIGIAGDLNAKEAADFIDDVFANLPSNGQINFVKEAEIDFNGRVRQIARDSGQNMVLKALPGVSRNHEDFYPLFVANYIWGGAGLTSKLSQQLREKEGLTYGVYSYLSIDDKSPLLVVAFSSTADKFKKADTLLNEQTRIFRQQGVSKVELENAKNYLIASYNLRFASIENIAEILTAMQKYNLGLDFLQKRNDYIANISLEKVNEAAQKYFDDSKMISVEIGKF